MPYSVRTTLETIAASLLVIAFLVPATSASASGCRVKDGSATYGNVQDAVNAAAPGDTLVIHDVCVGSFTIDRDLRLVGSRGGADLSYAGAGSNLLLTITSGVAVTIRGLGLNGFVQNSGTLRLRHDLGSRFVVGAPASIHSTLVVVECYFTASHLSAYTMRVARSTFEGGEIGYTISGEVVTVVASTITGINPGSDNDSGAILAGPRLHVIGSTIAGNLNIEGGSPGIESDDPSYRVTISSSILYNNDPADCAGIIHSGGYNIVGNLGSGQCQFLAQPTDRFGIRPLLARLGDNGGFAPTKTLLPGSPAIDAIPAGAVGANRSHTPLCRSGSTDERGVVRPQGSGCDIGAVEVVA